jgi:hypothetical protein
LLSIVERHQALRKAAHWRRRTLHIRVHLIRRQIPGVIVDVISNDANRVTLPGEFGRLSDSSKFFVSSARVSLWRTPRASHVALPTAVPTITTQRALHDAIVASSPVSSSRVVSVRIIPSRHDERRSREERPSRLLRPSIRLCPTTGGVTTARRASKNQIIQRQRRRARAVSFPRRVLVTAPASSAEKTRRQDVLGRRARRPSNQSRARVRPRRHVSRRVIPSDPFASGRPVVLRVRSSSFTTNDVVVLFV